MGFGGGKQTQTSTTEIPKFIQDAAKQNLARAGYVSQLGYVPQYGVDIAGFSPMQQAAMQNTSQAAQAFGLGAPSDAMSGMPQMYTDPSTGFTGYSSGRLYENMLAQLAANRPAQYEAINSMFIDPQTGSLNMGFTPSGSIAGTNAPASVQNMAQYNASDYNVPSIGSGINDAASFQMLSNYLSQPKTGLLGTLQKYTTVPLAQAAQSSIMANSTNPNVPYYDPWSDPNWGGGNGGGSSTSSSSGGGIDTSGMGSGYSGWV